MNVPATHIDLIREAETLRFCHGTILALGQHLPAEDADLDQLIGHLVATKNEKALTPMIFAALAAGRRVEARHLVEGACLFPAPDLMSSAAWHCTGPVAEALVEAVKGGLMGAERQVIALIVAAVWSKEHPDFSFPEDLITQARLLARETASMVYAFHPLIILAKLLDDKGLKSVLKSKGAPEVSPFEKPILEGMLQGVRRGVLEFVPERPEPLAVSGFTVRRAVERVGRNDPCPCGSGKKYKKCCFDKDRERLLHSTAVPGLTDIELRQQPELDLSLDKINNMRSYELSKLDPEKVPVWLRIPYSDCMLVFGLLDPLVTALEKWPWGRDSKWIWIRTKNAAIVRRNKPILERLIRLHPQGKEMLGSSRLGVDLILAGDEGRQQLDLVETAARQALSAENPDSGLADLAFNLLDTNPALGIIAAHCAIPMADPKTAESLLGVLLEARDRLNLPPDDPMCDVVDEQLYAVDDSLTEDTSELIQAKRDLEAKAKDVRKLQQELDNLNQELKKRESQPQPQAIPSQAAPAFAAPAVLPTASPDELKAMRERLESVKTLMKQRHNERNQLRRELKQAREQIDDLRQKPATTPATPRAEESEDRLLDSAEVQTKQPIRLPDFPRHFHDLLTHLPQAVTRSCLAAVSRLAAADATAFTGVKRLKALPDVYRQRISDDYRLLFRLHPDRLEIIDLILRRDLERKIKTMM